MELIVELFEVFKNAFHVTCRIHQVCNSEVIRPSGLSETRTWHCHNSSLIDHLEAVDEVRRLALLFGILNELLREMDLWEAVHGALNLRTRDLLHVIEVVSEEFGSLLESIEDVAAFGGVLFETIR